jgi:hypothetical protein
MVFLLREEQKSNLIVNDYMFSFAVLQDAISMTRRDVHFA